MWYIQLRTPPPPPHTHIKSTYTAYFNMLVGISKRRRVEKEEKGPKRRRAPVGLVYRRSPLQNFHVGALFLLVGISLYVGGLFFSIWRLFFLYMETFFSILRAFFSFGGIFVVWVCMPLLTKTSVSAHGERVDILETQFS